MLAHLYDLIELLLDIRILCVHERDFAFLQRANEEGSCDVRHEAWASCNRTATRHTREA